MQNRSKSDTYTQTHVRVKKTKQIKQKTKSKMQNKERNEMTKSKKRGEKNTYFSITLSLYFIKALMKHLNLDIYNSREQGWKGPK